MLRFRTVVFSHRHRKRERERDREREIERERETYMEMMMMIDVRCVVFGCLFLPRSLFS